MMWKKFKREGAKTQRRLSVILSLCLCTFAFNYLSAKEPLIVSPDFIKEKGEISFLAWYSFYDSDHFWNKHGQKRKAYNRLRSNEGNLYLEYGVTERDTLGVLGYYVSNEEKLTGGLRGIGDVEVCWKRSWIGPFSSRVVGIIPVGDRKTTVRYGEWGVEVDGHWQREFIYCDRCGWVEVLAGYRYYHGSPSDFVKVNAVGGYQLFSKLRIVGGLYLDYGIDNGNAKYTGPVLTLPPHYRLLKAELHGVISLTNYAYLVIGGFRNLWGRNIGTGGGIFSGFWLDF